ncbi:MAG: sigma-70 family RNA polymerase sigma factor [Yoonia sp.]|nr:sigma-70 family RNA polymerase sigma factor [Yoonia sp.]
MAPPSHAAITTVVRRHWGRILAALIKQFGDFALAEDALQDAVVAAMTAWDPKIPDAPDAWLITTARRRALDRVRADQTLARKSPEIAYFIAHQQSDPEEAPVTIPDKRLEMLFTCCHPSLDAKTQIALTLRTLGGLTAEEIAHAYLDKPATMAQRLSRARVKIKAAGIPYRVPDPADLPARADAVMQVIHLIFNEGYLASSGDTLLRRDLSTEAIRLGHILCDLMPDMAEPAGLLALMLANDARAPARQSAGGAMIPLETQDRSLWRHVQISQADQILQATLTRGQIGLYQLQAAISALHGQAATWGATDWPQTAMLYSLLCRVQPTPVVQLNHAVAVSYADSVKAGLHLMDALADPLADYSHFHAAKADFLARDGQRKAARDCFQIAINLTGNAADRAFLQAKKQRLMLH